MRSTQRTSSRRFTGAAVLTTIALACITGGMAGASPPAGPVDPHEPWIVYHLGHLGLVRPDGSDDHAILPDSAWYNNPTPPAYWGHPMYPDWSSDGTRIAFNGDRGGEPGVAMPIWGAPAASGRRAARRPPDRHDHPRRHRPAARARWRSGPRTTQPAP